MTNEWQTRTWEELKAETQARAERGAYPGFGIKPEDGREALAMIAGLDPEEWGAAWMAVGDRYAWRADAAARRGDAKAVQEALLAAWRLYTFGRWPVARSSQKLACYAKAKSTFALYGRSLDPAIETVRIPFEGKEIVGLLQVPDDVAG